MKIKSTGSIARIAVIFLLCVLFGLFCMEANAQTTEFTYQGTLKDSGNPANANYDFEFALFDAVSGGNQVGATIPKNNLLVTNGVFAVKLDFGSVFPGANRYLEVRIRQTGQPTFTTLSRQLINSAPYSVKAVNADNATNATNASTATNATQLGGVAAGQYVITSDPRMSDARSPLPNSPNYVQNQNGSAQGSANFNISGNGKADTFDATTQFNLGGNRILSNGGNLNNLAVGYHTGLSDTGNGNSFVGGSAGEFNTLGGSNSFFGSSAGRHNTEGNFNTFIGGGAGVQNTKQVNNTFVGLNAGFNTGANDNSFIASRNTFVGRDAGWGNETGFNNTFVGMASGDNNGSGINNSALGYFAYGSPHLINATSIGAFSFATQNNSLILGSISGVNNCTAVNNCNSVNVGIGTTAPTSRLHLNGDSGSFAITFTNSSNTVGRRGYRLAFDNDRFTFQKADDSGNFAANQLAIDQATGNVGIGTTAPATRLHVSGPGVIRTRINSDSNAGVALTLNDQPGWSVATANGGQFLIFNDAIIQSAFSIDAATNVITVNSLGTAGGSQLCRNASNQIANCSSSLRYKTNIVPYSSGLSFLKQLRPISFDWKQGGMKDIGFGAEDVAKIDPLFVTYNDKGEVEGVKYDRLSVAFVNAFKEQQAQIDQQQRQIQTQQQQLEALKALICAKNKRADFCR